MRWNSEGRPRNTARLCRMKTLVFALAVTVAALVGCGESSSGDADRPEPPAQPRPASATLAPTAGPAVTGTVVFAEVADGIEVAATVENLTPGDHAFHV